VLAKQVTSDQMNKHCRWLCHSVAWEGGLHATGCLCELIQNIFISSELYVPPFRVHIKIAHLYPLLRMLQFLLLHFLWLCQVKDTRYRWYVDISIEMRQRSIDPCKHLHNLSLSSFGVWLTAIAWLWSLRSVRLCIQIPCPPRVTCN